MALDQRTQMMRTLVGKYWPFVLLAFCILVFLVARVFATNGVWGPTGNQIRTFTTAHPHLCSSFRIALIEFILLE
jgi:hypothetical protein